MHQFVLIASLMGLALTANADTEKPDWPNYGVMDRAALEAYFNPGIYRIYTPEFESNGSETIVRHEFVEEDGDINLYWESSSIFVEKTDLSSVERPFIKSVSDISLGITRWDQVNKRLSYRQDKEDIDASMSDRTIWMSWDDDVRLSPNDIEYGPQDKYYKDAYENTEGDCCYSEDEYVSLVAGMNTINCAFIAHPTWDIRCIFRNVKSQYYWTQFYSRLEEGVS
jgi:hypothetical protein